MHEWEALATQVFRLSESQLIQAYVGRLKPYIQKELKMHNIASNEKARHKAKAMEKKLERSPLQKIDKGYSK